jgi:hypothetical protein
MISSTRKVMYGVYSGAGTNWTRSPDSRAPTANPPKFAAVDTMSARTRLSPGRARK